LLPFEIYEVKLLNKQIVSEIDDLLETYCDGCLIKNALRQNGGKTVAHRFCINTCTVGDQLQFLGAELTKVKTK
jgi:hypothetical protein